MIRPPALLAVGMAFALAAPAMGQSRQDRVDQITGAVNQTITDSTHVSIEDYEGSGRSATPRQLMRSTDANIDLNEVPAKLALEMWSLQTDVPLVINWAAFENEGIDPDAPITLRLQRVPAEQALRLIIRQMHPDPIGDDRLIVQVEEWYVQVMTRGEALQNSVTQMYFIGDMLMDIPDFEGPEFDLNQALSNTNSGGSGNSGGGNSGGGGGNDFFNEDDQNNEPQLTREEKAEAIAQIIRDTIESDIWVENGGEYASIRYYRGMLIVKAPAYVQEQIGVPTSGTRETQRSSARRSDSSRRDSTARRDSSSRNANRPRSTSGGVSGTNRTPRRVR